MENNQQKEIQIPDFLKNGGDHIGKQTKQVMDRYEKAKKFSCGNKPKKAVNRRKKKNNILIKKIIIIIVTTGTLVVAGKIGYDIYQANLPENIVATTAEEVEKSIEDLSKHIHTNIKTNGGNAVINTSVKGSGEYWYYDFTDAKSKFGLEAINTLMEYVSFEEASEIWNEMLTEEERNAIIIDAIINKVTNFENGKDNKRNVVLSVSDREDVVKYSENSEEYIKEQEKKSEETIKKIAQIVIKNELEQQNTNSHTKN